MKTIEDLEKEYGEYECRVDTITSLKEMEAFVLVLVDEIEENIKILNKDKRNNIDCKIAASIRNSLLIFETEDLSFYDKDNLYVKEGCILSNMYITYYKRIIKNSNDYNFKEMGKLADFIMICYDKDLDYLYGQRDDLEYSRKGYGYIGNCDEDNSLVVCEFITDKINELSNIKGIEKVKKM